MISQASAARSNLSIALDSDISGLGFLDDLITRGDITNDFAWDTFFDPPAHPALPPGETQITSDKITSSEPVASPDPVQHVTLSTTKADAPRHVATEVHGTTMHVDSFQSTSSPWLVGSVNTPSFAGNYVSHQSTATYERDNSLHSSHVVTLGKIISSLDSHVADKATTIDKAMQISKDCIDEVVAFMTMDSDRTCRSCKTLVSTIVELIIELYENASSLAAKPSDCANKYPKLSFGSFTINSTEYPALYQQVIHIELRRLAPIINILRSGCGATVGSSRHARHQETFSEMDQRIRKLTGLTIQA
ncbi:hypothetical protein FSARC_11156 [Fusarium sarcochroum]|uniref:Uncharacterized protein n=1 Tax=Fusarium sarcochroum TaxID=1208366 RepID=A0A8H4X1I9_9HYPO|nr:hypothetical protein FSARC_11156 [Fusarium sarcochroum]